MSAAPKTYRIYSFDSARRIVTADWLEARDDDEAVGMAMAKNPGTKCELWDGRRMVAELAAERQRA